MELASEIVTDALNPEQVLIDVGLVHRLNNFPAQLSGGEQQRVSIARAVAKNPKILLCDEPTGALDYQTGKQVLKILQDMSRQKGATVIIVTHNGALAPIADRVIHMHDASVKDVVINQHPQDIDQFGSTSNDQAKTYWKDLIQSFTGSKGRFFIHLNLDDVRVSSLSRPQSD